jgi:glycosyltransferase involved in cell wall biosynthesis
MCAMANYWAAKGWPVRLLTLAHGTNPRLHNLNPSVAWEDVDFPRVRARAAPMFRNLACVRHLRRAIVRSEPDVVISFLTSANVPALMATRGLAVPVIVSERIDPAHEPISKGWKYLRRSFYPRAAAVVVQTHAALAYFSPRVQRHARVIPNAVWPPADDAPRADARRNGTRVVVGLGRLAEQKRFDLLVRAFAAIASRHPAWNLEIWGEGAERSHLEQLVQELHLTHRITLPGRTDHACRTLRRADLFVLSSSYEGFPNALCEALACGVASISVDCPSGPGEVIRDGVDGLLVPRDDFDALVAAMDRLMNSEAERQRLAARAPEVVTRFGVDRIMGLWETLIDDVVH